MHSLSLWVALVYTAALALGNLSRVILSNDDKLNDKVDGLTSADFDYGSTPKSSSNPTASKAILIAEDLQSALVRLRAPGLPLTESLGNSEVSSTLLLNFSVSDNGNHFLLNDEQLALCISSVSTPSLLRAEKVSVDWDMREVPAAASRRSVGIDCDLWSRRRNSSNDRASITSFNQHPRLYVDIIGAGMDLQQHDASQTTTKYLLDSPAQKVVEIRLHDQKHGILGTDKAGYRIVSVRLMARLEGYRAPRPDDHVCSRWSWRCADNDIPPWYRYVWRENFDEYGRIDCMRRAVFMPVAQVPWRLV